MRIEALNGGSADDRWEVYADYRRTFEQGRGTPTSRDIPADGTQETPETKRTNDTQGCETCENRKYQDGSDDPGVSYKAPTKLSADQAATAVRGHEMEHVGREQSKAQREGRRVVSQSVTYHSAICPECGSTYVSGGTTRTVTKGESEPVQPQESQGFDVYA